MPSLLGQFYAVILLNRNIPRAKTKWSLVSYVPLSVSQSPSASFSLLWACCCILNIYSPLSHFPSFLPSSLVLVKKLDQLLDFFYSPLAAPLFARTLAVGYLPWIVLRWVWMLNWTDNGGNISHSKPKDIWWCISWWLTKTENQPSALKKLDLSWNITAAFVTNVCCNICEKPFAATFVKIILLQHLWKAFCCNNCEKPLLRHLWQAYMPLLQCLWQAYKPLLQHL